MNYVYQHNISPRAVDTEEVRKPEAKRLNYKSDRRG